MFGRHAAMAKVLPAESAVQTVDEGTGSSTPSASKGQKGRRGSPLHGAAAAHQTVLVSGGTVAPEGVLRTAWRKWHNSAAAASTRKMLRGREFSILTVICLMLALFLFDAFIVAQIPSNEELDAILTVVFVVFLFEFVGLSVSDATYPLSFFFWMDFVGTMSMLFDISYLLGDDATAPEQVRDARASDNVVLVRIARAAKLGARAGRLSRVLKLLRYMPFLYNKDEAKSKVKLARVITNQLNTVLAQRVAFLTICIVVMMPVFEIFKYPERDNSFTSWAQMLARDVDSVRSHDQDVLLAGANKTRLERELQRFADFYNTMNYGPFEACYGLLNGDRFDCKERLALKSSFHAPRRLASIRQVSVSHFQASYDMAKIEAEEAAASMGSILLVIVSMVGFGLLMSNSISAVALTPLERILSVVRERCKEIFKFASGLQATVDEKVEEDDEENDQDNEFQLLEDIVVKLAGIAALSGKTAEPEVTDNMAEEDVIKLNWMQGNTQAASGAAEGGPPPKKRVSLFRAKDVPDDNRSEARSGSRPGSRAGSKVGAFQSEVIPAEVMISLDSPDCNVLNWSKDVQLAVCNHVMKHCNGSADWVQDNVGEAELKKFIKAIEGGYMNNPFHNFGHGVDVLYMVSRFLRLIDANGFLTEASQYLLMVAAIAHDVGHLGLNNQFLVETSHDLAVKYNDMSPMEMLHCAKLFQIMREPGNNIFGNLETDLYKEMRKGIIAVILHTDMSKHADMLKELGLVYQMNSEALDALEPASVVNSSQQSTQMVLNMLLHLADVNNPMKPWELCKMQAHLCLDEFFAQGDKEKELGVPVQFLNDRLKVNRPNSQVGFIEFVISPLCEVSVRFFPQLDFLADNLGQNICLWNEVWQAETNPEQGDIDKVTTRVMRVKQRCQALLRSQRMSETSTLTPRG